MNPLGTEVPGRRSLLNGLVTAATRSWRNGFQSNGHNSNSLVFPTISTSVNNSSTCRTPATDNANITEEQRRWQQRQEEHRLNLLWYGGDEMHLQPSPAVLFELHNRYQSPDDWEKQPLRQRRRKSQQSQHQGIHKNRSALPISPIVWAVLLHTMYSAAMAAVYYIYGVTSGSGWIWLKEVDSSSLFKWLCQLPPMWYFVGQAFCAVTIGYVWYQWQKREKWCCYMLIALFITAIFPSVPLAEVFVDKIVNKMTKVPVENSAERQNYYNSESLYENQLALYEGLWHVSFFIFVSYCLVLPTSVDGQSDNEYSETINEHDDNQRNIEDNFKEDRHISTAVLLFAIVASLGHTTLNMYIAYHQQKRLVNNSSMAAIQQLIANVVVLACVNLAGWLLRQSIIQDRIEIRSHEGNSRFNGKHKYLRAALRRQADKLNQLLTSLLPRRVFLEMKHDIVADAARSYNAIRSSNDNSHRDDVQLQRHQQEILLKIDNMPRMYLKEYENVSVVFANVTGFWDNAPLVVSHDNSGPQTSMQVITLIDRLLANLFRKLAYRNRCLPIRLLGHRMYFIAGLPDEESYGYDDDGHKNGTWMMNDNGHARNAIQMGLDLIDAVNTVVRDVSRFHNRHKINLNVRVGVHSGRVACGVLGFTGGTGIPSDSGSRWQYSAWGRDVHVASYIENCGRSGMVHVSRATVNQVTKKGVADTAVNRVNHVPPGVKLRNNSINYQTDSKDNLDDYSFERSREEERNQFLRHNRIDTYFVIPKTVYPHSENTEKLTDNYTMYENGSGDIVSLILQSVDQQLLREEMRQKYAVAGLRPETEMELEQLPAISTTAIADISVTMAALVPVVPVASVMKRNRHRRSRYFDQESQQAASTNINTNCAITSSMERYSRWENDVFVVCNNDDHEKVRSKSDDDDLFRIAKSQLLLLCVIIALFVVNVTTMPWTMLLGITFITPFVITAGELIYVMALLIDWIPRPRFYSTTYATAIIADDDEYYHHYDNIDSDTSSSSNGDDKCLRRFFVCHPGRYSLFAWLLKPFQCRTNTAMTTRNHLDNGDGWRKCYFKWCRCYGRHSWFTCCLNNQRASSCMSSDDSDIESRLGFRNENAIMAATTRTSPPRQQIRRQHSQPINMNNSYNNNLLRRRHRHLKRIYQDEERRTYFYWTCACCELIVVLLICLLALLNAFTCEPVEITATNTVYDQHTHNTIINGSGGFNTPTVNTTQPHRNPLTCMWPQYAVLTCCLVYVSIAIAFPIYYGSLPTLRMKIGILLVMTCVFAVAFVHFTHKHVFIAASMSSPTPSFYSKSDEFQNHRTNNTFTINYNDQREIINAPVHSDGYRENQRLLKLQDREQQRAAGLNTATATVYAISFAIATLACFVYKHRLQDRRAHHRVKVDRDLRRLRVLREAHRRTLHAIVPDHVATLLRRSCRNDANDADDECERTQHQQNYGFGETRPIRTTHQSQENMPAYLAPPLYQCGYRSIVILFATIVQQEQSLPTNINRSEKNDAISHHCHKQLALLHNIFSEFDRLLDNQKYRGLIEKIKMLGTNTYMAAVGLQHHDGPKRRQVMLLKDMKERCDESCNFDGQETKNYVENYHVGDDIDNDLENEYELYNIISANYITFALDFIREMRRALHRQQTETVTPVGSSNNSQPSQFVLRVGVNVGPAVAGLIGCNDRIWKRPQFDVWGNTVNEARQMDITSIPGRTQVTSCVVDIMQLMHYPNPKYEFETQTKMINKDNRIPTYFVRESFERDEEHNSVQRKPSNYHLPQLRQNSPYQYESDRPHQQNKQQTPIRSSQNVLRTTPLHLARDQPPLNVVPLVNVHSKHSHYNSMVQQDSRQKCLEPQKTPPPPPPPRSPPPVTTRRTQYPMQHQYSEERDRYPDIQNRSRAGVSQSRCASNSTTTTAATYARPLQKQQHPSTLAPVPHGLVQIFGDSQHLSPPNTPTTTEAKPTSSNHSAGGTILNTALHNHQQPQQVRRPNVLLLKNTTSASTNKFDANRPLPDPPRSSDTVAGRHRNRDDPRRRRRRQHNQPPTITKQQQEAKQDIKNDHCLGVVSPAWPSSSSFRSPISVGSFVSVSSPPSSLSSSSSTDAGGTTTSNNNYNTTTTASSSDDSYGCTTTEDCAGIDRVDTENVGTAAPSVAISSAHHRYRQQQQLLLHQWSPSTTANSSPVKRSSSFRSPLSAGDNTAASSSSLRSPPIVGHTTTTNFGGTQSLNRRHVRSANTTSGAGSSSSRRRRRRQQQQNNTAIAGNSTPPAGVIPDVVGIMNTTSNVSTEKYESSSSSPWKKQQQRRQITTKDQGTGGGVVGPDFTDEIRRILLLDQHRGNVRQQQGGPFKEEGMQVNRHSTDNKDRVNDNVAKHLSSSEQQHLCIATVSTMDRKPDKDDKNNQQVEKDITNTAAISVPTTVVSTTSISSASLFEERERQITEQVKRQQAEVRRILQEHKNNVVAVVRGPATVMADAISHSRKQRVMSLAVESSWSDDESLEPSSSLLDNKHRPQRVGFKVGLSDYEANSSIMTAETEYTTGGEGDDYTTDGDGYTTTGYTTDEAAAPADRETDMPYAATISQPDASTARQLDDNLSTLNDTGLTDAEAALSDVNSMIDYNDCNDNNRYRGRRQSSLSSNSVCPYASDSFCEDDDDYNDDGQYFFWDGYHVQNENVELGDDDDDNDSRYNHNQILLQQQLSLTHPSSSPPRVDGCSGIDKKRSYQQQQLQQSTTMQTGDSNTTTNITPRPIAPDATTAVTSTRSATTLNPSSIANNTSIIASPNYCSTASNTLSSNTELDGPLSSSNIIKDMS